MNGRPFSEVSVIEITLNCGSVRLDPYFNPRTGRDGGETAERACTHDTASLD